MISLLTIVRINNAKIKSPKLITIERVCWFLLVFHPAFTLATAHSNNWFHSWLEWICLGQGLCATRASLAGSIWLVDEEEVDRPIFSLTDWRRERERERSHRFQTLETHRWTTLSDFICICICVARQSVYPFSCRHSCWEFLYKLAAGTNYFGKRHGLPLRFNQIILTPAGCICISFMYFSLFSFYCDSSAVFECVCVGREGSQSIILWRSHTLSLPPSIHAPFAPYMLLPVGYYSLHCMCIYCTRISQLNRRCKAIPDLESFNQPPSHSLFLSLCSLSFSIYSHNSFSLSYTHIDL
jgi:hypothetical protein